ncbi:MAG: hypothetical protein R3E79_00480 [Caldilineaceae bacterium]
MGFNGDQLRTPPVEVGQLADHIGPFVAGLGRLAHVAAQLGIGPGPLGQVALKLGF